MSVFINTHRRCLSSERCLLSYGSIKLQNYDITAFKWPERQSHSLLLVKWDHAFESSVSFFRTSTTNSTKTVKLGGQILHIEKETLGPFVVYSEGFT